MIWLSQCPLVGHLRVYKTYLVVRIKYFNLRMKKRHMWICWQILHMPWPKWNRSRPFHYYNLWTWKIGGHSHRFYYERTNNKDHDVIIWPKFKTYTFCTNINAIGSTIEFYTYVLWNKLAFVPTKAIGSTIEIPNYVLWIKTHFNVFWAMLFKTFGNKIMF